MTLNLGHYGQPLKHGACQLGYVALMIEPSLAPTCRRSSRPILPRAGNLIKLLDNLDSAMVIALPMSQARRLIVALLTFGLADASLSACGNGDGRPSSLVSSNGDPGHAGGFGGQGGALGSSADAGGPDGEAGSLAGDAGAAGEPSIMAAPRAVFPEQLQVDVGCGASTNPSVLVIQNAGLLPLIISSAEATAGYVVKGDLPLQIGPMSSAVLEVSAAAPKASASVGARSTGTLTLETNEPDAPSHDIRLDTTLFGGVLEFTDGNDKPLTGALPLTYLSSSACPDRVKYRIHNTGNLTLRLFGPTFPTHFGGATSGANGHDIAPDDYVELDVSGNSSTDGACSGSGELSFTVQGSLCGALPKLSVTWPANVATSGCSCVATSE